MQHPASGGRTTQAAEGLPRWRWTTGELVCLVEVGALSAETRIELVGGEIVPTAPVGRRHELVAELLERHLRSKETVDIHVSGERQLNLAEDTYTKPDIIVRPASILPPDLTGETVLAIIEVAKSSLDYDLGAKAARYAQHGVREYWIVNARTLVTTVYRKPQPAGYAERTEVAPDALLVPLLAGDLSVRLGDLRID